MKMCFDVKSSTYHFHMTTKMLADFQICISAPLKQIFWKKKTIFKKLEYHFLVEKTKIEKASFPCKTEISEARQIKWWLQNGPITKNEVFPITTLFLWNFFLSLRTCNKELICCANDPTQMPFCKRWSFDDVFALRVSLGYFIWFGRRFHFDHQFGFFPFWFKVFWIFFF